MEKVTRCFTSVWFLNCCLPCCSAVTHTALRSASNDKVNELSNAVLRNGECRDRQAEDSETEEHIELNNLGSQNSLMKSEVIAEADDLEMCLPSTSDGSVGNRSSLLSASQGAVKRLDNSLSVVSETDKGDSDSRKGSDSDCESSFSIADVFPKCRLRRRKGMKNYGNGSKKKC